MQGSTPPWWRRAGAVYGALAAMVAWHFFAATTFLGDDHVFLAFARFEPNPFAAFVADKHGGEYYRPLPMLVWWLVGRAGRGAAWPFAIVMLVLHGLVAWMTMALLRALGREVAIARLAGVLFFVSPATREAAYWFSASTDLLATAATLGSILLLLRGRALRPDGTLVGGRTSVRRQWATWCAAQSRGSATCAASSVILAAAAYLSKEPAVVLPALALVALRAGANPEGWRGAARIVVPHAALAAAYVAVRWRVLGALGGSGDDHAGALGRALQIASGVLHTPTAHDLLPEWLAWGVGVTMMVLSLRAVTAALRVGDPRPTAPIVWIAIAVAPLLVAGWVVGARYFYLPAVGIFWLIAERLFRFSRPAAFWAVGGVAALGFAHGELRRSDISSYQQRVAAARRAVIDGTRHGHRFFHIETGGIKDLDLAVKLAPELRGLESELFVLSDTPASFAMVPATLAGSAAFLLAVPPLPPSGAYVFGDRLVQGLARRDDSPDLADVVARLPGIRFIRLRTAGGPGRIIWRDVTDEKLTGLRGSD